MLWMPTTLCSNTFYKWEEYLLSLPQCPSPRIRAIEWWDCWEWSNCQMGKSCHHEFFYSFGTICSLVCGFVWFRLQAQRGLHRYNHRLDFHLWPMLSFFFWLKHCTIAHTHIYLYGISCIGLQCGFDKIPWGVGAYPSKADCAHGRYGKYLTMLIQTLHD